MFGSCVAVSAYSPCAVVLPPGDVAGVTVMNDSDASVTLVNCDDDTCRQGADAAVVQAGGTTDFNVEECGGATFGVADPHTLILQGCIGIPGGEPFNITQVTVSEAHPCRGSSLPRPIRVYNP